MSFFLSLSVSLSGWFPGARRPAKLIFLHGLPRPLKTSWEGTLRLRERYKLCPKALLVFCISQGLLASFLLSLFYRRLQTTRFRSIKGPQQQTFIGKVMSLLFNILSRLVITFLPRSKHLLISWLQLPTAVILEPPPPQK